METELLNHFLPEGLLNYFEVIKVETEQEDSLNREVFLIHLDEKNELRSVENGLDFESKGFVPPRKFKIFLYEVKQFIC